ncbi:MAG: glycosyltransferase [Tractidigestivibacter sp.]|uniref:glycosyltransferase n=1 Tax=Tractidigestivibacter sp. TaxID=2847320 RepID=UPI003D91DC8E
MSETAPMVSVLIPICNVEKYLDQCLGSLKAQTYTDFEAICINDGSTDSSADIIRSYVDSDPRFHMIDKANSGYGDSMNKGLEQARGKYIAILESDDFMDPDALEYMVGEAERQQLQILKCNFWLYWSKPTADHTWRHNLYFELATPEMILMGPHAPIDFPSIFWAKASIWSALYLRSFIEENHIRFLPTPGASFQDTSFTFKAFSCAKRLAYSGRAFLHYRQDNEKSSINSPGKVFCLCDEHAEMKRFLDHDRPDLKPALDPVRAYVKYLNYRWNYERLSVELKPQFLERFSQEMREEVDRGCIPAKPYKKRLPLGGADFGDFRYFDETSIQEVQDIINDPSFFAAHEASRTSPSKIETFKNYWNAGGLRYVMHVFDIK